MSKTSIGRLGEIWKANINNFLDQMEEPEKMVRQAVREMEDGVEQAAASLGKALANERRLESECQAHKKQEDYWGAKAEATMAAGREDEARAALEHKMGWARRVGDMEPALDESRTTTQQLKEELQQMRVALEDARNRQGTLIARYQAMTRKDTGKSRRPDGFARFKELEGRVSEHERDLERWSQAVEEDEAEAEVYGELARATAQRQQADTQARVEEELTALRRKAQSGE
ncbi:MAG: hypothetical protein GKR89_29685 [Candidatus Latescibacteria bacterium]|nr:hypothetical protein [Candidatus Latescibacterota bacterium]